MLKALWVAEEAAPNGARMSGVLLVQSLAKKSIDFTIDSWMIDGEAKGAAFGELREDLGFPALHVV